MTSTRARLYRNARLRRLLLNAENHPTLQYPTVVASVRGSASVTGSVTNSVPVGSPTEGNRLIAMITVDNSTSQTLEGWTELLAAQSAGTDLSYSLWTKIAATHETSATLTLGSAQPIAYIVAEIDHDTTPTLSTVTIDTAADATLSFTTAGVASTKSLVMLMGGTGGGETVFTKPEDWHELRVSNGSSSGTDYTSCAVYFQYFDTGEESGAVSVPIAPSTQNIAVAVKMEAQ